MAGLIEGLDDLVGAELDRLRAELREAIRESGLTHEQVAAFAGIGRSTLADFLGGRSAMTTETLARVMVIAGASLSIEVQGVERPLRVALPERGSLPSSGTSRASAGSAAGVERGRYRNKAKPKRERGTGSEGASNPRFTHTVFDLRERIRARREVSLQHTFHAHPALPAALIPTCRNVRTRHKQPDSGW